MSLTAGGTVVVLGATGYTGRLAVDALLRRGTRPVLAGRRVDELTRLSEELGGLEWRIADATDPASIRALVDPGDVLLTTVGPFERFGYDVAQAAASVGAHYVDSTGEVGFVREVHRRYDDLARRNGPTMLPAFGYDYVPGTLAGALALDEAPDATRLEIGYFATGPLWKGLSQGTRSTMADGLTLPTTVWRDGRLTDVRTASALSNFYVRGRRKTAFLSPAPKCSNSRIFSPRSPRSRSTTAGSRPSTEPSRSRRLIMPFVLCRRSWL